MKFLSAVCLLMLSFQLHGQQIMYVASDSAAIYNYKPDATIQGYLYYGDTVSVIEKTKEASIDLSRDITNRTDMFSNWVHISSPRFKSGWIKYNQLKSKIIPPPAKIIGLNQGDIHQDEIYPIGWSKNAFAYIIEGYIDGAVDGLTVRYYAKNFNGVYMDSVIDYTSYEEPIHALWQQQAFNIQNSLLRNKIVPLTNPIKPDTTPILVNKKDTLHLYWDMKNFPIIIKGNINGVEKDLLTIESGVYRIMILGTLKNPFDKNKMAIIVAYIMDATAHYVDVIMVDLKKFKK